MIPSEQLMIDNDLVVGDLTTIGECDEALRELATTIEELADQVRDVEQDGCDPEEEDWFRRLKITLRLRRAARVAVLKKRANMRKADSEEAAKRYDADLLAVIKEIYPAEFAVAVKVHRERADCKEA